jgi:hypothetical protein
MEPLLWKINGKGIRMAITFFDSGLMIVNGTHMLNWDGKGD